MRATASASEVLARLKGAIRALEWERRFEGRPYPAGLTPFPEETLAGQGFFPGGDGLWRESPCDPPPSAFPIGGVMILGNDFGLADHDDPKSPGFRQCLQAGFENPPTWTIKETLRQAGIPEERCFFTNSYLGLRIRPPVQGASPGLKCPGFAPMCRSFLEFQLELMRPSLVVLLGHEPRKLVAPPTRLGLPPLTETLRPWCRASMTFRQLDAVDPATGRPGSLRQVLWDPPRGGGFRILFALLAHPSFAWSLHARHPREYGGQCGEAAERALVREAYRQASIGMKGKSRTL